MAGVIVFLATFASACGKCEGCGTQWAAAGGSSDAGAGHFRDPRVADVGSATRPSPYIVVDQFGYRTSSEKIAVIRSPQVGFDAADPFTPGVRYALVDARSDQRILEGPPVPWNGGATDASSGDKAWWFDFSSVTRPGDYFVLDETKHVRSAAFSLSDGVYRDVLVQAMRMFYYQRDGIVKAARYAGPAWADEFAHPQDASCTSYKDGLAPRDLRGGWFDAGDQNRYTNWAASDVIELLRAYVEAPAAFSDDYNIPESGNGVPDVLDEVKWELDWLARMQERNGAVLSIASHVGASPPSTDKSPCKYGPQSTSATLTSAAAFAFASIVFRAASGAGRVYPGYADALSAMAQRAWGWADTNPDVTFYNAQNGVGAGEQEVDASGRLQKKAQASVFIFELTADPRYKAFIDSNYSQLQSSFDPFHMEPLDTALEYARAQGATPVVAQAITRHYKESVESAGYFGSLASNADPYLAYLSAYPWGSNQDKAGQGNMFADIVAFGVDGDVSAQAMRYAERYVHYVDGVNPLGLVYLSNMGAHGAESSVTRFFHTWFAHGSKWDAVGSSTYGPPPGYLTGGPNSSYAWDACCPSHCRWASCGPSPLTPPTGQPPQKSYRDFNDAWPLDSWQVTEPDDGYQAQFVRLLSKFVR